MGDIVRLEAARLRIASLLAAADKLMEKSPHEIARRTLDAIARESHDAPPIVVGPRTIEELLLLRSELSALVVAVDTPTEVRRARWRRRHLHIEDTWDTREAKERAWCTSNLIGMGDVKVSGHDWVGYAAGIVQAAVEAREQ